MHAILEVWDNELTVEVTFTDFDRAMFVEIEDGEIQYEDGVRVLYVEMYNKPFAATRWMFPHDSPFLCDGLTVGALLWYDGEPITLLFASHTAAKEAKDELKCELSQLKDKLEGLE